MFRNYLKTAVRNLLRNRTYSFLNITGLATGLAIASLIFLWVEDEISYNNFPKKNQVYRVMKNNIDNGKITSSPSTPGPLAEAIKKDIPGIRSTARLSWGMGELIQWKDREINEGGIYADPALLTMLPLDMISGDANTALNTPDAIVISENLAKRVFGTENPLGKTISMNAQQGYSVDGAFVVKGVYRDLPKNGQYQFHWVSQYKIFEDKNDWIKPWTNNLTETLVELEASTKPETINHKLKNFLATKTESKSECFLFSMNDWYLRNEFTDGKISGGRIKYVNLFSLVAIIVLVLACINFMNLSTARSEKRAREVGMRKVMGAGKKMLVTQFMGESLIMSFASLLLAIGIVYLAIPYYNELVQKELEPDLLKPSHLAFLLSASLITGVLSGSYPAFYLSAFNPIKVLKGARMKTGIGAIFIRKGLVVAQFSISIALIICTVIIYQQIQHIKTRDLGFTKDKLIRLNVTESIKKHFVSVRQELLASGQVENAALSLHAPLHLYSYNSKYKWQGKDPNVENVVHSNTVSPEYVSTLRIRLLDGKDFHPEKMLDSTTVLINESMAKTMGDAGKVGSILVSGKRNFEIAGIVKDFLFNDMYASNMPVVLFCNANATNVMTIRLKDGMDLQAALSRSESIIKANNEGLPFEFKFVDEEFDSLFETETLIGKLSGIFAALAILISCLGLFGLAAYTAERRTKEIGIRKVLGATIRNVAGLLSKDFLLLVVISCLISFPIAWLAANSWLENYQYRIDVKWWVFGVSGTMALLIALLTVSFQSLKAAVANPIRSLRNE